MKKEYIKPEFEKFEFSLVEEIATGDLDGEMGTSELPEGWE